MGQEPQIVIVEDDPKVRKLLRSVLEGEGFGVSEADDHKSALAALDSVGPDLITLDLHLGSESGLDLAREIRRKSSVPIVMVTGLDDVIDRIVGLEIGADDYITKPFHIREVIARIRAVLRRNQPQDRGNIAEEDREDGAAKTATLTFDGIVVYPDRMEVVARDGSPCPLTSGDFTLLKVFLDRPKRVLSRDQLMDLTGGQEWSPLDRTIDNQVARLRKKIERNPSEPRLIKTIRGIGYTFACDIERKLGQAEVDKSA